MKKPVSLKVSAVKVAARRLASEKGKPWSAFSLEQRKTLMREARKAVTRSDLRSAAVKAGRSAAKQKGLAWKTLSKETRSKVVREIIKNS